MHVTQRCQEGRYLLRFKQDRRQYLQRLREATARHPVSILNYMVTSNHVHLLIRCRRSEDLTAAMQFLSGCMAQDYNRRKSRSGSFWSGRYRPTLVQNGRHLSRCFFYIALNMVRAGAVGHPSEWIGGSHAELLADPRAKDAVIDRAALLKCLGCVSEQAFANWYTRTLDEACATWGRARQAHWSEAAAVGDEEWVRQLAARFPSPRRRVELLGETDFPELSEESAPYVLRMGTGLREGLLGTMR